MVESRLTSISRSGSWCRRGMRRAADSRFFGAGPLRMRPAVSYCEPWQGQNQPSYSPWWASGMQPRWVQMPITTSHCSWPFLTRSLSGSGSGRLDDVDVLGLVDLFLGAMEDEDRLGAPEHLDDLSVGDRREVDFDRRARRDGRGIRIHLRDQRHQRRGRANGANGAGGDVEKVAARMLRRRHGRHV